MEQTLLFLQPSQSVNLLRIFFFLPPLLQFSTLSLHRWHNCSLYGEQKITHNAMENYILPRICFFPWELAGCICSIVTESFLLVLEYGKLTSYRSQKQNGKKKNTIHSSISWNDYITWQLWDIEKNSVEVAVIALIKEALQVISSLLTPQLQLLLSVHLLLCYQMTSTFESQISKLPDQGHLNLATAEEKQLF